MLRLRLLKIWADGGYRGDIDRLVLARDEDGFGDCVSAALTRKDLLFCPDAGSWSGLSLGWVIIDA